MTTKDYFSDFDGKWSQKMGKDDALFGKKKDFLKAPNWSAYEKGYFESELEKLKMDMDMQRRLEDFKYGKK